MVYQQFQGDGYDSVTLAAQASQELDARLTEVYGTTDKFAIVTGWLANPSSVPAGGEWGLAHAAISLLELHAAYIKGAAPNELVSLGEQHIARWYAREAVARCNDMTDPWPDPLAWHEDSRLDYWTPRAFIEWYLTNIV